MSVDDLPPVLAEAMERLGTLRTCRAADLESHWRGGDDANGSDAVAAIVAADEAMFRVAGVGLSESQIAGALRMRGGVLADNVASWDSGPVMYAACLAALSGQRLHMMAVDDGDARRRAAAVEGVLDLLGLSVRVLGPALPGEGGTGLDGSVPTFETRGGTYAADVVVGTPERFALDYLVDKMASSPEDLVGHEFGWVFLPEADYFLLDQAFERVWVDGEGSTLSRIRIHEYLRLYDTACGVTPIQLSDTDREEMQRLYGFEVVRSDRLMIGVELPDVTHPYHDGRLVAVARSAVELRNRGRRVVVGVSNPDHVGDLISALRRESAELVVVGEGPGLSAVHLRPPDVPDAVRVVTGARCRMLALEPSSEPDQPLAVLVVGRSVNRRDDFRFDACAADAGGRIRFFVSDMDELTAPLAFPLIQRLQSTLLRVLRRNVMAVGPFEVKFVRDRQIEMGARMADHRRRRHAVDTIEDDQRRHVYDTREEWLSADNPMSLIGDVIKNLLDSLLEDQPDATVALTRLATVLEPSVSAAELETTARTGWAAVFLNEIEARLQHQSERYGAAVMNEVARQVAISVLDRAWREQLVTLDRLIGAHYRRSPTGDSSIAILRAGADAQADEMWQSIRARTVGHLISLELDLAGP